MGKAKLEVDGLLPVSVPITVNDISEVIVPVKTT